MARQLREGGFHQMRATSLKGKHINTLLTRWQPEDLSAGTLKNRLAGPRRRWPRRYGQLKPDQQAIDRKARQIISRELGHERRQIVLLYLGR